MRLLHVQTLKLHEFFGVSIPPYAILSHRWEDEEVTFQALLSGQGEKMSGWCKITGCCNKAINDGLEFAWIDSCCIDKTSSAELSEAINSMFQWYQDAEVCYAYLSDVQGGPGVRFWESEVRRSKWFTRGWTLQELLAPEDVVFFNSKWSKIGTKETLQNLLKSLTGIHHLFNFEEASVAQKMSWSAARQTTRVEDTAYCLMGLFGVNMPTLYGEGKAAFLRLQFEIMRISNDESIFAWKDASLLRSGLLAPSPGCFKNSGNIKCLDVDYVKRPPYSMTNKGLQINVHLVPVKSDDGPLEFTYVTPINCTLEGRESIPLALTLSHEYSNEDNLARILCGTLGNMTNLAADLSVKTVYVQQPQTMAKKCTFKISIQKLLDHGFLLKSRHLGNTGLGRWGQNVKQGLPLKISDNVALLVFQKEEEAVFLRISVLAGISRIQLLRCGWGVAIPTLTDGLLREPRSFPPELVASSAETIRHQYQQIGVLLPSSSLYTGQKVVAFFRKRATYRHFFEIELALVEAYNG